MAKITDAVILRTSNPISGNLSQNTLANYKTAHTRGYSISHSVGDNPRSRRVDWWDKQWYAHTWGRACTLPRCMHALQEAPSSGGNSNVWTCWWCPAACVRRREEVCMHMRIVYLLSKSHTGNIKQKLREMLVDRRGSPQGRAQT